MSITIDVSEDLESYKNELNKLLQTLEKEINLIQISNDSIPKAKFREIESLLTSSENNVRALK